jgi:hypothetical protein
VQCTLLEKPSVAQDQNMYVTENMSPTYNYRENPASTYVDRAAESTYVDDGIFRHIHVLVLHHAWFSNSVSKTKVQ